MRTCGVEEVEQEGPLVALLHPHHLLGDVLRGGADPPHRQEDVVLEEIPGEDLNQRSDVLAHAPAVM